MRLLIGAAALAGASAITNPASAEIAANVALASDYIERGISMSDNGPAIQGGLDWTSPAMYAGAWASSHIEGIELAVYGGVTPVTGPIKWDFGFVGNFYPGADDDIAELDHGELVVGASTTLNDRISLGVVTYYAPQNFGDTGEATYIELSGDFALSEALVFSAAYGNQRIEDPDGVAGGAGEDDYNAWNVGGIYAFHGFTFDLRYHDTDIAAGSDIENYAYGRSSYDAAVVFTIGREL